MVQLIGTTVGEAVLDLLNQAYLDTLGHMHVLGENALIPHGTFTQTGAQNLVFTAENANNHQITWGALCEAIEALASYMGNAGFGRAWFMIFEGGNEVGVGSIE